MSQTIELAQTIDAPLDLIWRSCAQPRGIVNWQSDEAEGDVRLGGRLRLHWAALDSTVELEVIAFEPKRVLGLRQGKTAVEFHFQEREVTLVHHGLRSDDDVEGLRSSWRLALAQLAHYVERHPGRQRRVEWLIRHARVSPELFYLSLTEPQLSRWLIQQGSIPAEGEPYELVLRNDLRLSGRVLANVPGRDVALSCREAGDAVLAFRTLPAPTAPGARFVAAVWSEWGPPRPSSDDIVEALGDGLDELLGWLTRVGTA